MLRQGNRGVMMERTKTRKRGCSSSSSSSSRMYNYRLNKRAILVGRNRAGLGGSRSTTPVPTWRTTPLTLRGAIDSSPKYSQSGKSTRPVSARKLAATLWGMNEMPSPKMSESNLEVMKQKRNGSKIGSRREKVQPGWGLQAGSGFLPPHLSDPSHSPTVSEKMDTSRTRRKRRETPSISEMLMYADQNVNAMDSVSNRSFMEIETRSRPQTSSGSVVGSKNRLKDVSNALTTSKELLKIINRIWAHADPPSSSLSLVSALHTELERARLQVNQLIQENRSDKNGINHLMKCFSEEKASWRNKEQQAIEAAVGSVVSELEAERKLRRRLEILNKKLGQELAEMKSSFVNVVKELETEKRAREVTEQVCNELARNIDEDRAQVERLKRESFKVHEEVEKEREMLQLADKWREERVQMKLSEAKHQFEEKNSALSKLRKQLEVFLGPKRDKEKEEDEEVVDAIDGKEEDSAESELHSIELNLDTGNNNNKNNKGYKWAYTKARNSVSGQVSQRTIPLQRSVSDGLDTQGFHELEKEASRSSFVDETKGHKDRILSTSRFALSRENHGPSQQKEQSWPLRDPCGGKLLERSGSKSRTAVVRGEGQSVRRSKW